MTPVSNTAEIAEQDQSATDREAPPDRNMTTIMSPRSVPQVLQAAIAIQYQGGPPLLHRRCYGVAARGAVGNHRR